MVEIGLFKLIQTFWGLAVVLGIGGYSLYETVLSSGTEPSSARAPSAALVLPTPNRTPLPTPLGGYPTPSPLTIFFACDGPDGDAVRYYVSAPGGSVVLRIDVDRDLVVALMNGEPTRFPANANLVQSACVRSLIRQGRFP